MTLRSPRPAKAARPLAFASAFALTFSIARADVPVADRIGVVFYIAMENHNWTQPASVTDVQPILNNPAAPFINSLVTRGSANAALVSYASNYRNVSPDLHPSEPNYVFMEAGAHGPLNDKPPFPVNIVDGPSLSALLAKSGKTWRSYQEDIDLLNTNGRNGNAAHGLLTNTVAAPDQSEVPLTDFSGTSPTYTNFYNGSHQWSYAAKHNPMVFFLATNGGADSSPANPQARNYAPLQQLAQDLANDSVADYNWITPEEFNDMHTALDTDFVYRGVVYR